MTDDTLVEILDRTALSPVLPSVTVSAPVATDGTQTNDATYARENIRALIDAGIPTLQNLIRIANDSQHPRAYEVATQLMKTMSDLNKDLMEIHKKELELSEKTASTENAPIHVKNAVFVGTTKELRNHLKS